jgi:hypothetical protein
VGDRVRGGASILAFLRPQGELADAAAVADESGAD